MPKFSEIARVVSSELGSEAGLIPDWMLLWRAMYRIAEATTPMTPVRANTGRLGVVMPGNIFAVADTLWPGRPREELTQVVKDTGAHKMVTLRHKGEGRQASTYWVALVAPEDYVPPQRPTDEVAARKEAKVTAAEAGEDRQPAPVVVRHPRKVSPRPADSMKPRPKTEIQAFTEVIFEAVKISPIPLTFGEIQAQLADVTGVERQNSYRRAVDELVGRGLLFKRPETTDEYRLRVAAYPDVKYQGRPPVLIWHEPDVPVRTTLPPVLGWRGNETRRDVRRPAQPVQPAVDNTGETTSETTGNARGGDVTSRDAWVSIQADRVTVDTTDGIEVAIAAVNERLVEAERRRDAQRQIVADAQSLAATLEAQVRRLHGVIVALDQLRS